ncbi:MAG: aminoglycoside phosphotransferase family protein [Oscillospiraceae bacterium]|nr:aminoglycoside phosphotransferase family protein [Oscillospiraceae bacterium]
MKHPDKWRETIDPFSLPYKSFKPTEILGYPHAGNDVFYARGLFGGKEVKAYIKVARQKGAAIENEVAILSQFHSPIYPTVIDYGFDETTFSVTLELSGERLSVLVGENETLESLSFMEEYGASLARLHQLSVSARPVKDRRFFHSPPDELLNGLGLGEYKGFFANPPKDAVQCFCHGDFHYANILWDRHHISGILDFELSGIGNRDFDIAWAMFRRPGQKFMKTDVEQAAFLRGYQQLALCDHASIQYYMAQCYVYFLRFSGVDTEYCDYVRFWLNQLKKGLV